MQSFDQSSQYDHFRHGDAKYSSAINKMSLIQENHKAKKLSEIQIKQQLRYASNVGIL